MRVRLSITAETVDSGANPLGSHVLVKYPSTYTAEVPAMPEIKQRMRSRTTLGKVSTAARLRLLALLIESHRNLHQPVFVQRPIVMDGVLSFSSAPTQ